MTHHGFSWPRLDVERLRASASRAALTVMLSLASVAATAGTVQGSPPPSVSAFFTVDPQNKRVYEYDGAGLLAGSFALIAGNDSAHGLTIHSGALHVLDSTDREIYEYDQSGTFQAVSRELRQAGGTTLSTTAGARIGAYHAGPPSGRPPRKVDPAAPAASSSRRDVLTSRTCCGAWVPCSSGPSSR